VPLYHQVYLVLRQRLLDGTYPQGEPLPGEIDLTRAFSVSRITVRRALQELADEGLVARHAGRGTFPTEGVERQATISGNLSGLLENLLFMGLKTQVQLLDLQYGPPPAHIAARFAADGTLEVQRAVRVRSSDGIPFSYLTTYVPAAIGRTFTAGELSSQPLLALLERAGIQVTSAEQTVAAAAADTAVADALGVPPGTALLKIVRLVRDERERLVECLEALYRPDRYTYRMELQRSDENGILQWTPR
jgi:GntR family transcriptional regulator